MKKSSFLLFVLTVSFCMVHSQNDTMYVFKNGVIVETYKSAEVDSIIFYKSTSLFPDTLNIEGMQFQDMATRTANYIDANQKIPTIVYTDASQTKSVTAAELFYMMSRWLRWIKNNGEGSASPSVRIIRGTGIPPLPSGAMSGTFTKDVLLEKGKTNADFIDNNSYAPNYSTVGTTQYSPIAMFYAMVKTIRWYTQNNNTFPADVIVTEIAGPESWPANSTYSWNRTLDVPYTDQPDSYTCGPTSLRMVMAYYGTWQTVSVISSYMASIGDSPYYDGVGPNMVVSAAKYYGFNSTVTQYGWDNLKKAIADGHPVIANIQTLANSYPCYYPSNNPAYISYSGGHFIVVVGLKAAADGSVEYVEVNDPSRGNVKYTTSSFDLSWVNNKNRLMIRLQ